MSLPTSTQESALKDDTDEDQSLESQESGGLAESQKRFQKAILRFSFDGPGRNHSPARGVTGFPLSMNSTLSPRSSLQTPNPSLGKRPRTQHERPSTLEDTSPSKKAKRKKPARGYSSPEVYSHLNHLNDCISESLDIIFCGINPGQRSAEIGHHFGHPSNHFWKCLHLSGLTSERMLPAEDFTLPERYQLGLTNIVERPTAEATELKDSEFKEGITPFLCKMARYRPRIACFIGLRTGRIVLGLQPYKIVHYKSTSASEETLFYSIPSTSGKTQGYQIPDKVQMFTQLRVDLKMIKDRNLSTDNFEEIMS
ncbi:uracil-DNA glycosylase-like protein [Lentinula aciculospora]|uniref:Uracil-DNA glycosylase-like protein n=1 Tax=Lentinula aciculospora TaxID=153920 RepID=A0A9W9DHA9_9AGAR|nr:uracil-DNA glycosylase-like protein [Lentinula aciculospora]